MSLRLAQPPILSHKADVSNRARRKQLCRCNSLQQDPSDPLANAKLSETANADSKQGKRAAQRITSRVAKHLMQVGTLEPQCDGSLMLRPWFHAQLAQSPSPRPHRRASQEDFATSTGGSLEIRAVHRALLLHSKHPMDTSIDGTPHRLANRGWRREETLLNEHGVQPQRTFEHVSSTDPGEGHRQPHRTKALVRHSYQ